MGKGKLRKVFDKRIKYLNLDDQAKEELFNRFRECWDNGFKCAYCGEIMNLRYGSDFSFSIDHVLARRHGGMDSVPNLCFCCSTCNSMKADKGAGWFADNVERLKARKQRREEWKARKATKKDKGTREAYVDIFEHLSSTKEVEK